MFNLCTVNIYKKTTKECDDHKCYVYLYVHVEVIIQCAECLLEYKLNILLYHTFN